MESMIQILYSGTDFPVEQLAVGTEEYNALRKKNDHRYETLRQALKALDKDLWESFGTLVDEQCEIFAMEKEYVFGRGFRMGAHMMMELQEEAP